MWILILMDMPIVSKPLKIFASLGATTHVKIHAICYGRCAGGTAKCWMESTNGKRGRDDRPFLSDKLQPELMILILLSGRMPWLWNRQL